MPDPLQARPAVWNWDLSRVEATVNRVRAGRDLTPEKWPNAARVAVALSFDMDAETGFLCSGNHSPQPLSRGEYGPRVGVPRILRVLEKYGVPVTFFIPAVSGHLHPDTVDAILNSSPRHEIGIHSWIHERIAELTPEEERTLTIQAFEWWTSRLGHKPRGIRTASWDFTAETLAVIRDLDFLYDSSLMGDDRPYEIVADSKPTGLVELPVEWILDDYTYYGFDWSLHAYHRMADSEVYDIYQAEFEMAYDERTLFLLSMHPFVTGHRSRLAMLEKLIGYMQSKPQVWFATHEQVAAAAAAQIPPGG
ncbi:MAG TPA: polysaccharide deacetylase [Bryobacteraceae bacterium]|nr:polysaccharide deacetylase [Bryobacteraceae bacterium]